MKKLLSLVGSLLLLPGCSIYHPQPVDIPLINHSRDARVDVSASMSAWLIPDLFSFNVTGAYGFNDWLTAQAHANFGGDNYYGQIAPGFYYPLGEKSVIETYVGIGYGGGWRDNVDQENSDKATSNYSFSGHYMLPFVQGNFGWHDLSALHIDLAFGLKLGDFKPDFDYYDVDASGDEVPGTRQSYTASNFLIEPQFMLRLGGEHMKLSFRAGYAWLSDLGDNGSNKFIYDPITGTIGLTFFF